MSTHWFCAGVRYDDFGRACSRDRQRLEVVDADGADCGVFAAGHKWR